MTRLINSDGRDVTAQTLDEFHKIIGGATNEADLRKAAGTVQLSTGLVAYNLEAPAKNLYPVLTPLRNRIPRNTVSSGAGTAANWKQVSAIQAGGIKSMPWVPEGQRAPRMSITEADKSATYRTIGVEADVTFEAQSSATGFEDVMSTTGMRQLQQTMILEEYAILGANASMALGTPTTPTLGAAGSGATLPALTYSVIVVALTLEGVLAADTVNGVVQQQTITGMDGQTYQLNGGSSMKSAAATQAVTLGQTLSCSTPVVKGAIAYAWYVGAAGAEKIEMITYINSVTFSAPLAGTGQAATAVTADRSNNSGLAFDGLLYSAFNNSTAYYNALATGVAGTGTVLTGSGRGSVNEIDTMLKAFWDNYRISPDEIYVNSQELNNITNKALVGASSAPMVRFNLDVNSVNPTLMAGQIIGSYFNPFSLNGGQVIPIRLHPNLPAGTLLAWCQNLPAYYQSANVPQVAGIQCRRDYYQIPWPIVTRSNASGVYSEEVLKVYAPFALGIITNIANG